jgi:uncharacterized protein
MIYSMEFTCNAIKNEKNIQERGLPLLAAQVMFNSAMQVLEDTRFAYPERRFIGYNTISERLMVVVFCTPNVAQIHIISFRKANLREQSNFKTQSI